MLYQPNRTYIRSVVGFNIIKPNVSVWFLVLHLQKQQNRTKPTLIYKSNKNIIIFSPTLPKPKLTNLNI